MVDPAAAGLKREMYYTYVIKSEKDGRYYIGSSSDVEKRLEFHNQGLNVSTKHRRPFVVVFKKEFPTKLEAVNFEFLLKKQKGGDGFRKLTMLG